jgi:hypothetical protein
VAVLAGGEEDVLQRARLAMALHGRRIVEVARELPDRLQIGIFEVNCQPVCETLVQKHRSVLEALQHFVAAQAGGRCEGICASFDEMASVVRKPARSPEHAVELRAFYVEVEGRVEGLLPQIAECARRPPAAPPPRPRRWWWTSVSQAPRPPRRLPAPSRGAGPLTRGAPPPPPAPSGSPATTTCSTSFSTCSRTRPTRSGGTTSRHARPARDRTRHGSYINPSHTQKI